MGANEIFYFATIPATFAHFVAVAKSFWGWFGAFTKKRREAEIRGDFLQVAALLSLIEIRVAMGYADWQGARVGNLGVTN